MKPHFWPLVITFAATTAAIATPKHFLNQFQDILSDVKDSRLVVEEDPNPLDSALFSLDTSPLPSTTATTIASKIHSEYVLDPSTWIKNFLNHPIDDIKNLPKVLSDLSFTNDNLPPHHPRTSNKTIYQLIAESKYTTILAKIIKDDPELVDYFNSTDTGNITFFAPTDHAFSKLHRHHRHHDDGDNDRDDNDHRHHRPSKEFIRSLIKYHSSPDVYSAAQIFHSHTLPSGLNGDLLGNDLPQRLTVRAGLKGLVLNFYSRIVAIDIGASNGLIHALDSLLFPPPKSLLLLDVIPSKFSTFTLALYKTDLIPLLNSTSENSSGRTIFVPSNSAFQKLGLRINAFLFSPPGQKYLRALLEYHIVPDRTLYSDVLYTHDGRIRPFGVKGFTHLDLPTSLRDRSVAVDVARFGPYASFKINGYHRVAFADALARDGNLHILDHVLIPPKKVGDTAQDWTGEEDELTVEDLKERLRTWVDDDEYDEGVTMARALDL